MERSPWRPPSSLGEPAGHLRGAEDGEGGSSRDVLRDTLDRRGSV